MVHLLLFICVLVAFEHDDKEALLGTVYFNAGTSTLTPQSDTVLKGIADKIRAEPNLMIDIIGYTDNTSSADVNIELSKNRAEQVKQYLANLLGEHGDRIQTFGLGSKNPIAFNATETGRRQNRRAEISVREPDAILTWFDNDVKVQPPFLRPRWLKPASNYYLYHDYTVTTGKLSHANILYPNKSILKMDEEAMVIIHRMDMEPKTDPLVKDIKMQNGSLETLLNGKAHKDDSTQIIASTNSKVNSLNHKTIVDEKLKNLIAAYEGDTIASSEKELTVADQQEPVVIKQDIIGRRPAGIGVGVFAGEPAGISLKVWGSRQNAADIEIGWSFPDEILYVVGDYLFHFPNLTSGNTWFPYLGVGVELRGDKNEDGWQLNPGIRFGGGFEYIHRSVGVFAELYPVIELVTRTPISVAGGIGVRFYISN